MVFEKPLIDRRELMRALDPVHGRGDEHYDRLVQSRMLSEGVTAPKALRGGAESTARLYCSLNRDAISAVRGGQTEVARKLCGHAQRIERETLRPWLEVVAESWIPDAGVGEMGTDDGPRQGWVERVLFPRTAADEAEIAEPIFEAAREVAEVRARFEDEHAPSVRLTVGRVWRIDDVFSEVRPETPTLETPFAFFSQEVLDAGLRLGDPVVIRHEELAPGVFLTTFERALDRGARVDRVSGQPLPHHLEDLLDSASLSRPARVTQPLRRVA